MGIRRKIAKKRTFSFAIFTAQKIQLLFKPAILSSNYFPLSYSFLSIDSLTNTKRKDCNTKTLQKAPQND